MPTLQFKGKSVIQNHHLSVPYHTIDILDDLSISDSDNKNLLLEGDNLIGLKSLLPQYAGKVRCIYIDPPYNTGNENGIWVYNDNVNSPLINDWLGKEVGEDDLAKHDKWLCMMTPRLKLLRELMSNDGVIFISIDDYEADHLKVLMGEIFGAENFIGLLPTIMNLKGNQDEFAFAGTHEYTLVFAKSKADAIFYEFPIDDEGMDDWEEDDHGFYKKGANLKSSGGNAPREKRPNLFYPILFHKDDDEVSSIELEELEKMYDKDSKTFDDEYVEELRKKYEDLGFVFMLPISDGQNMSWRWQHSKVTSEPHNIILNYPESTPSIYKKQRPEIGGVPSKKPKTTFYKPEYSSGNGTNQLKELFGDKVFPNPKPLQLIKDFIQISTKEGDIVLDSFAGSGTTGHAVMQLEKEGLGKREFVLLQMKEDSSSEPDKNLCKDVTRERLSRAIDKYKYKTGFKYAQVGSAIDPDSMLDGNLPEYNKLAEYVFYLTTGSYLEDNSKIDIEKYYVGEKDNLSFHLIYEDNFEALTKMALTLEIAESIVKETPNKRRLVFAPACFLDEEYMEAKQIEFVSVPYNLFERKS